MQFRNVNLKYLSTCDSMFYANTMAYDEETSIVNTYVQTLKTGNLKKNTEMQTLESVSQYQNVYSENVLSAPVDRFEIEPLSDLDDYTYHCVAEPVFVKEMANSYSQTLLKM